MYEVGSNCHLKLYQLHFTGPGVHLVTETISSKPQTMSDVIIRFTLRPLRFLKEIRVVLTTDARPKKDAILPVYSKHCMINNIVINGKYRYAWMVPIWTNNLEDRATNFRQVFHVVLSLTKNEMDEHIFGWTYIKTIQNPQVRRVIADVGLVQLSRTDLPRVGWQNKLKIKERFGNRLYLCWNSTAVGRKL